MKRSLALALAFVLACTSVPITGSSVAYAAESGTEAATEAVTDPAPVEEAAAPADEVQQGTVAETQTEETTAEPETVGTTEAAEPAEPAETPETVEVDPAELVPEEIAEEELLGAQMVQRVAVTGVSILKSKKTATSVSLKPGAGVQLTGSVQPADATNAELKWTSEDESVATVDATGKITAAASGTTVVTASSVSDPSVKAEIKVTVLSGTWKKKTVNKKTKWQWKWSDGSLAKNEFIDDEGKTYYIGSDKYMKTGLFTVNKKKYYASGSGALQTGWQKVSGKWYFFEEENGNAAAMGWRDIPNDEGELFTYRFDSSTAVMKTGWFTVSKQTYYANSSGQIQKGWLTISKTTTKTVKKKKVKTTTYSYYYLDPETGVRKTGWQTIDGQYYYFNSSGVNQKSTGWQKLSKIWYYFEKDGNSHVYAAQGWKKVSSKWYYLQPEADKHGAMKTGWFEEDGKKYYLNSSGASITGIQTVNKVKYLFLNEGGKGVLGGPGWNTADGKWYYINPETGAIASGQVTIDGKGYYFDAKTGESKNGAITVGKNMYLYAKDAEGKGVLEKSGWKQNGSDWYYLDTETGIVAVGRKVIDGKTYYFDTKTGISKVGIVTLDKKNYVFVADEKGRAVLASAGVNDVNGKKYLVNEDGTVKTGFYTENAETYYYDANGMVTGWQKVGSKWYYLDTEDGTLQKGWITLSGKKYYLDPDDGGAAVTGWKKLPSGGEEKWFYFDTSSTAMKTGIVYVSAEKKYYYLLEDGTLYNGPAIAEFTFNGAKYKIAADGVATPKQLTPTEHMDKVAQKWTSKTSFLIMVDRNHYKLGVYKGSKGNWTRVRGLCDISIGTKAHPSKTGDFKILWKANEKAGGYHAYGWWDFNGSTAFYCTYLNSSYFFHTILYAKGSRNPNTAKVVDARMNKAISHSCIRLMPANAKYIFSSVPNNTRVIVFDWDGK